MSRRGIFPPPGNQLEYRGVMYKQANTGGNFLWFYADPDGTIGSINYNDARYSLLKNAQGDVIGLADSSGNIVALYSYDSWGNIISITDGSGNDVSNNPNHIANINPIRYRGYYYDTETGFYYLRSRYYDPETCRFINADGITDGGAGLVGNNLFQYAANNPVNNCDPSGQWIIKDAFKKAVKWTADKIVKPVVKGIQNTLSKVNATCTKGISANFSPGIWNFNIQGGVSIDTKGNVAFQGTFAGGVTTNSSLTASIGKFSMITNAPSINELNGIGYQIGGSASIPIPPVPISINAGREFNIIPDSKRNTNYYGITTVTGIAPPTQSMEVHIEWGQTGSASFQFNAFDVMQNIYVKIMEW